MRKMDRDGDGVITQDQHIQVFAEHSRTSLIHVKIEKILDIMDVNGSGLIDFTLFQWLPAISRKYREKKDLKMR